MRRWIVRALLCGTVAAICAGCNKKEAPKPTEEPVPLASSEPTLMYLREALTSRSNMVEGYGQVRAVLGQAAKRDLMKLIGASWKSFEQQPDAPVKTAAKPEAGVNVFYPADPNENLKGRQIDVQVVVYRPTPPEPLMVHVGIYTGPYRSFYLLSGPDGEAIEKLLLEQTKK